VALRELDGFRGIANTVQGRMLSKNGNRLRRFEPLLNALPAGYVFDGEIVALDGDGRPMVPQSSANELAKNLSLGVAQPRLRRRAIEQNSSNQEGPDADQFGNGI
jgi:hypothetical protein